MIEQCVGLVVELRRVDTTKLEKRRACCRMLLHLSLVPVPVDMFSYFIHIQIYNIIYNISKKEYL